MLVLRAVIRIGFLFFLHSFDLNHSTDIVKIMTRKLLDSTTTTHPHDYNSPRLVLHIGAWSLKFTTKYECNVILRKMVR